MIERSTAPGRIDLRTLAPDTESPDVDRILAHVFRAHAHDAENTMPPVSVVWSAFSPRVVPLAAAAALLLGLSLAALTLPVPASAAPPQQTLSTWVRSNHVPTNGELLSTFEGYDP